MSTSPYTPSEFFDLSQFAHASLFEECNYPWEALIHLSTYVKINTSGKIEIDIPQGVFLVNPESISIGPGTVIEPGAYIQGPCIIGARCIIRHGAYLRGDVLLGDDCIIGHATEIKHSILLDGAAAPHFNYIGDSILGGNVNLGAGVVCANLRLDHAIVKVDCNGKKIETGMKKLGAIIGDGAQVGCNCVLNPGTLLGKSSLCSPCLNISGFVKPHSKVKPFYKA
ncbi:MAG: UDP-N-acetylglucosamine diphosphorylase [Chlamydiales bacterium]|nr:UDP-N-acetylglucosamine diphosphorylase [Chlamydiales bacterium]